MAEIFRARIDGIGGFHRTFAVKRILPHLGQDREFVEMLVEEAKIAGLLSHANIVQILDLGHVDQQYFVAMEYVHGRDLRRVIQRCAEKGITLPVPHAVYVLVEILKGLEYAHQRRVMRGGRPQPLNVVHRDISPPNVLLSFQGEVKLTDFGIARASVRALQTLSGVVKGRFDYMSPEQAEAGAIDQRADLFSAGLVLYELLAGKHPFRVQGELATMEAIRRGGAEPPSQVNPDVPASLDAVVERALRVDPAERFATAGEFKQALDRFFHDSGFIFSASTLAAFLRGLFPEAEPRAARAPSIDDIEFEDDPGVPPTEKAPTAGPRNPTIVPQATPSERAASGGRGMLVGPALAAGLAEEATIVRAPPTGEWGDVETVIRPEHAVAANVSSGTHVPPGASSDPAPLPAAHAPGRGSVPRVVPPGTPLVVHVVYIALAMAMLVGGFVLGLVASTLAR
jgi:serine/threonine protein kinase